MVKKKKYEKSNLTEEMLDAIRVTPEQTQLALSKLGYTIYQRPEGVKSPPKRLWCYLCNDFRKFGKSKKSKDFDYARCEVCNISVEDYYVRQMNGLFSFDKASK